MAHEGAYVTVISAFLRYRRETADGRAINVGNGRNVSINQVADLVGGPRVNLPPRLGDARNTLADTG